VTAARLAVTRNGPGDVGDFDRAPSAARLRGSSRRHTEAEMANTRLVRKTTVEVYEQPYADEVQELNDFLADAAAENEDVDVEAKEEAPAFGTRPTSTVRMVG
jgi:hypothetical protein